MTDLTEKWKKGELPEGWYYINSSYYANGSLMWCENGIFIASDNVVPTERITEVLELVPSYEEYLSLTYAKEEDEKIIAEYEAENAKLKELLKEVGDKLKYINTPTSIRRK